MSQPIRRFYNSSDRIRRGGRGLGSSKIAPIEEAIPVVAETRQLTDLESQRELLLPSQMPVARMPRQPTNLLSEIGLKGMNRLQDSVRSDFWNMTDAEILELETYVSEDNLDRGLFQPYNSQQIREIVSRADRIRNPRRYDFTRMPIPQIDREYDAYQRRKRRGEYEPLTTQEINQLKRRVKAIQKGMAWR